MTVTSKGPHVGSPVSSGLWESSIYVFSTVPGRLMLWSSHVVATVMIIHTNSETNLTVLKDIMYRKLHTRLIIKFPTEKLDISHRLMVDIYRKINKCR